MRKLLLFGGATAMLLLMSGAIFAQESQPLAGVDLSARYQKIDRLERITEIRRVPVETVTVEDGSETVPVWRETCVLVPVDVAVWDPCYGTVWVRRHENRIQYCQAWETRPRYKEVVLYGDREFVSYRIKSEMVPVPSVRR